ncbi:protein toll-like [Oppia nitens]|uniref:protein toll-like n=1 Tax=Oppia nitens TaxID=1686743 RepID=UPI0023DA6B50|nr:protein toll-like [Oppia nitens]
MLFSDNNRHNISSSNKSLSTLLLFIVVYYISVSRVHCFATCPSAQIYNTLVNTSEPNCDCSQIQEGGWEITCYSGHPTPNSPTTQQSHIELDDIIVLPYAFFIRYEIGRQVRITCDNGFPYYRPALFQGFGIESIDTFSFENCPLPDSLPLNAVLHRTSSVSSVKPPKGTPSVTINNKNQEVSQKPGISKVRSLSISLKNSISLKQFNNVMIGLETLEQLRLDQFLINDFIGLSTNQPSDRLLNDSFNITDINDNNNSTNDNNKFDENFPNLKILILKSFMKDSMPGLLFEMLSGSQKLEYLELDANNLQTITKSTFSYAGKTLRKLYLRFNNINKIDLNAFANLTKLEILDLSNNQISDLPSNILKDLKSLSLFSIRGNLLTKLPETMFRHNNKLSAIDLSANQKLVTFPVNLLQNLEKLINFTASDCQLTQLSRNPHIFFKNSPNIENIHLNGNFLTNLTINGLFGANPKLSTLNFSYNNISQISREIFSSNSSQIIELNFYGNEIEELPENIFSQLRNLRKLNFGFNQLSETNPHLFLPLQNLEELYLNKNNLKTTNSEQNRLPFGLGSKLRKVNLSYNELNNFESDFNSINWSLYLNIAELDLRHNNFSGKFRVPVFSSSIAPIVNLDLSSNKFTSVDIQDVVNYDKLSIDYNHNEDVTAGEAIRRTRDNSLIKTNIWETHIRLDNNPINCDCFLEPFLNYVKTSQTTLYASRSSETTYRKSIFLIETEEPMCDKPDHLKGEPLAQLELSQLICVLNDQNICPSNCDCVYQSSDSTVVIDCDQKGLQLLPQELILSRYHNISLEFNHRIDNIRGVIVHLKHNHIQDIEPINQMFIWGNKMMKKPEFVDIYLDNNTISDVSEDIIPQFYSFKNASLPLIRVLSLRNNYITSMPLSILKNFDSFASFLNENGLYDPKLYLGDNPYDCHNEPSAPGSMCQIREFQRWLNNHNERIGDLNAIKCDNLTLNSSSTIRQMPDDILCPVFYQPTNETLLLTLTITCVILAISLFIVSVLYYRNKQTILAFIYIHLNPIFICMSFSEDDLDSDKIYDAFVSYSSADRDVVMSLIEMLEKPNNEANLILHNTTGASIHEGMNDQIIPENEFKKSQISLSMNNRHSIETNDNNIANNDIYFKLCIHERDWLPGNLISWNIVNSVQNSKRTILVLSKEFIESIWFQVEFHTAYYQMLEDKIDRLIVVVKGQLPPKEELDKDLAFLLTTKTYLVWGEKWFWEKLRYALPHKKIPKNQLKQMDLKSATQAIQSNGVKQSVGKQTTNNKSSEAMKDVVDNKIANHFNLNSFSTNTTNISSNGKLAKSGPKSLRNSSTIVSQSSPQLKNGFENRSFITETNT